MEVSTAWDERVEAVEVLSREEAAAYENGQG